MAASEAQDSLISLLDAPSGKELVLKRKLVKARAELNRVQGIYEQLLSLPSVARLDVRDEGKKIIDDITREGKQIIGDLRKTVVDLKKGKQSQGISTQTDGVATSSGATQTQQQIIPVLENVIEDMQIIMNQVSRKRKRGNTVHDQPVSKRIKPTPNSSLLQQALSESRRSSRSSSTSSSVFSPGSSPSGSSESSGGFDERAMDTRISMRR